jgi:hypothetical protein
VSSDARPQVFADPIHVRLAATVEVLRHIAETTADSQAARVDPIQAAWLAGYRQACTDTLNAHELYERAQQ